MKTVGYLRVSNKGQDNEKFKDGIWRFVNDKNLGRVEFIKETVSGAKSWKKRKIAEIIETLKVGDNLIVPEFSRLGRSLFDILEIIKAAKEKGVNVYDVKGGWSLNSGMQSKIICYLLV